MDAYNNILERKSVRKYTNEKISNDVIDKIMKAAMAGPSCLNLKDYAFIVVDDRKELKALANLIGRTCSMLNEASHAIVVLMDMTRAFSKAKDYSIIDASLACQNIMLSATALNVGSVMLGIYPQMDRVEKLKDYYKLKEGFVPHSIISLGYSNDERIKENHFEESRIHYNKW